MPTRALQAVHRHGVEIDWCPSCKGVWLERGELDKLIERAVDSDTREPRWLDDRDPAPAGAPRGKRGFLSEVFDFGESPWCRAPVTPVAGRPARHPGTAPARPSLGALPARS
jgi:Zn-finger nucleic acid-binding protein